MSSDSLQNQTFLSSSTGVNPPFVWEPSSTKRGTFQIFSLCASTTVICIWSAVHRDIPPRRLAGLQSYALQAAWVFYAFFLPEFVFVYALKQLLDGRRLVDKVNNDNGANRKTCWLSFWGKCENKEKNSSSTILQSLDSEDKEGLINQQSRINEATSFTLVHAFYAMMGGYAFDVDAPTPKSGDEERVRATIRPVGVHFLMKHDPELCPDFSSSSIAARSKSNGFNKTLLVAQLMWFCTSCISRLATRLPLTLLEVVTAAHGLCTLATYTAWWHKPLNVEEPSLIIGERARWAFAFLTMVQRGNIGPLKEGVWSVSSADREPDSQSELALALRAAELYRISNEDLQALSRENLVDRAPESESLIDAISDLLNQIMNAPDLNSDTSGPTVTEFVVFVSLPAAYGLVHLFGWNAQFPSLVERILWRIATIAICSCGALFVVAALFSDVMNDVDRRVDVLQYLRSLVVDFLFVFVLVTVALYLLSTVYILVESIRQLFYLPPEAFVVASWSNYFPHFS